MTDTPEVLEIPDELTSLKARADMMGITYHPSIGVEKLREKVVAALSDAPAPVVESVHSAPEVKESEAAFVGRMRREANTLIRVRVTCMNPNKKEWDGEVFTVGNSVVGTFSKFVPFNSAEDGWHIPTIIYQTMVERKCQIFTSTKDSRGNVTRQGKLIKEFSIEVLPPLTREELQDLAQRQAMAKTIT